MSIDRLVDEINNDFLINKSHVKRFYEYIRGDEMRFISFVDAVLKKYSSVEYIDKFYKRGLEPPCDLRFFLYDVAKTYGRKCSTNEIKKYGNKLVSNGYAYFGFYFFLVMLNDPIILIFEM